MSIQEKIREALTKFSKDIEGLSGNEYLEFRESADFAVSAITACLVESLPQNRGLLKNTECQCPDCLEEMHTALAYNSALTDIKKLLEDGK